MFKIHYGPLLQFKWTVIDRLPKSLVHCNWLFRQDLIGVPLRKGQNSNKCPFKTFKGIVLNAMEANLDNIGAIVAFLASSAAYSAHAIKKLFFSKETEHQKKTFEKSDELKSVNVRAD